MAERVFPNVKRAIEDFLFDEEGNIPRSKIISIGTMVMLLSVLYAQVAFAKHGSHSSHGSHGSHGSHSSHVSSSHLSHGSHYNSPVHSNSTSGMTPPELNIYEPDIGAPTVESLPDPTTAPINIPMNEIQIPKAVQPNVFAEQMSFAPVMIEGDNH